MCSLCAALGGSRFWTDAAGHAAFLHHGGKLTLRAEREERVRVLNRVLSFYAVRLMDWGGNSYILESASGRRLNVYTLSGIWSRLDELIEEPCDPLDGRLLNALGSLSVQSGP